MANKKYIILALLIMGALISIFYLPYYIAPQEIVVSASHDYGFNNRAAVLAVVFFVLCISWLLYKYSNAADGKVLFAGFDREQAIPKRHLIAVAVFYGIIISLLYYFTADIRRYGEGSYFFDKIDRLLLGQVPYIDFEYAYGPIFIYIPVWIFKSFKFLGLSLKGSFYIFYACLSVLGLCFFFYLLNRMNMERRLKTAVFYLLSLPANPLSMGFNCLLLRFLLPFISLYFTDALAMAGYFNSHKRLFGFGLVLFFIFLFNVSVSPDIGIFFLGSSLLYLLLIVLFRSRVFLSALLTYIFAVGLLIIFLPPDLFLVAKSVISGGFNFPVIPSPAILFYLASLFIVAGAVICGYLRDRKQPLAVAFIFASLLMASAALGICDSAHVFYDGLGLFLVSFAYMANRSKTAFRIYAVLFIIIFWLGFGFNRFDYFKGELGKIYFNKILAQRPKEEALEAANRVSCVIGMDREYIKNKIESYFNVKSILVSGKLAKYPKLATPFYVPEKIYDYLLSSGKYVPEYYISFSDVFTADQVQKKLLQLKSESHRVILISEEDLNCLLSPIDWRGTIFSLSLYPYDSKPVRNTRKLYLGIYDYIRSHYKAEERIGNYIIMKRQEDA